MLDESSVPPALALGEVVRRQRVGAVVLDTRDPNEFAIGHLVGSINVGLTGRYAEYAGGVIQPGAPIVLVTEPGLELEAKNRLARIGFDRVVGHLADPVRSFEDHPDDVVRSSRLTVHELAVRLDEDPDLQLVDVRQPGEIALGMIPGADADPTDPAQRASPRARRRQAHGRVLRRWLSLLDRRQPHGRRRLHRRVRPGWRLHGVGQLTGAKRRRGCTRRVIRGCRRRR